ncbi:hypothetical protein ALC56_04201, partial [Trachymyrmex septentrionalis]
IARFRKSQALSQSLRVSAATIALSVQDAHLSVAPFVNLSSSEDSVVIQDIPKDCTFCEYDLSKACSPSKDTCVRPSLRFIIKSGEHLDMDKVSLKIFNALAFILCESRSSLLVKSVEGRLEIRTVL